MPERELVWTGWTITNTIEVHFTADPVILIPHVTCVRTWDEDGEVSVIHRTEAGGLAACAIAEYALDVDTVRELVR